jgi:NitT/TauT family transport system substrate-binding protein
LRLRKTGRVLLDTTLDKPWSNYFCCVVAAHRDFAQKYPIATKRALRAILKAADICAERPNEAAQLLQTKGIEPRRQVSLEVLQRLPYGIWRDWSVEDTLRFHALRLKDVGMIQSTPNELVNRSIDLRHLRALQRELRT